MSDRITVRMTPTMLAQIDNWIAQQAGYVSRQEAVRRFVAMALLAGATAEADGLRRADVNAAPDEQNPVDQIVYLDV